MDKTEINKQAMSSIMNGALQRILDSLSKEYSVPFLMVYQGYEYQEIADHLNLPLGTVKSRIFYARKKLKSLIQSHYETSAIG